MKFSGRAGLGVALLAVVATAASSATGSSLVSTHPSPTYAAGTPAPVVAGQSVARADSEAAATTARTDRHGATGSGLPEAVHGPEAVAALGGRIDAVAANAGLTGPELAGILGSDPTAWVHPSGRLAYHEEKAPAGSGAVARTPASAAPTKAEVFSRHSLPGSLHTIYLDFDGVHVSDEMGWHADPSIGLPSGDYAGWDPSGDGDTVFSPDELGSIDEIWARVAEDYAPFDVDVTTAYPGEDALTHVGAHDPAFGTHVVITDSAEPRLVICDDPTTPVVDGDCGGVAWTGLINTDAMDYGSADSNDLAWVFPSALGATQSIAEAAAHEAGHTFGLVHDGTLKDHVHTEYYQPGSYQPGEGGVDDSPLLTWSTSSVFAPIMGAAYYNAVSQWSKAGYPNGVNWGTNTSIAKQDDVGIIRGIAGSRPDEAGGTVGTAVPLPTGVSYIGTSTDVDDYLLGECPSGATVTASPAAAGADLNLSLALLDPSGATVVPAGPTTVSQARDYSPHPLEASIWGIPTAVGMGDTLTIPAGGPYVLTVMGAGSGNWSTGGFDRYGSLGGYTLSTPSCDPVAPGAPTALRAIASATGTTVTWAPPASDGGTAITGYVVTLSGEPDQLISDPAITTATFADATAPGAIVTVTATNGVGPGTPASTLSLSVPSAPLQRLVVTDGRTPCPTGYCVLVDWDPPTDDGGSSITAYRVSTRTTGSWAVVDPAIAPSATPRALVPMAPDQPTDVRIEAVNAAGVGAPLDLLQLVRPGIAPGQVAGLASTVDAWSGTLAVRWSAPTDGDPVTSYDVVVRAGASIVAERPGLPSSASGVTVAPVAAGSYTASVVAHNATGSSTTSLAVTMPSYVVPLAPGAPRAGIKAGRKGGAKTVVLTWSPGAAGTQPISGFQVTVYSITGKGRKQKVKVAKRLTAGAASRRLEVRLKAKKGLTYAVAVQAANAVGTSPLSARSKAVTPR